MTFKEFYEGTLSMVLIGAVAVWYFGDDDTSQAAVVSTTPEVVQQELAQAETNLLTGVHKTCFETFNAEFRFTESTFSKYKADGKYGTYDDGEIWVGLQHKIYQIQSDGKTGKLSWTGSVSVICTADGNKSFS